MRRRNERVQAGFYLNKVVDGTPYLAHVRDISLSGVYLHRLIEPTFSPNSRLAIEFTLPGSPNVWWADVDLVREDKERGVGLAFRNLTPALRRSICHFLRHSS